jgi:hypothetical protein
MGWRQIQTAAPMKWWRTVPIPPPCQRITVVSGCHRYRTGFVVLKSSESQRHPPVFGSALISLCQQFSGDG